MRDDDRRAPPDTRRTAPRRLPPRRGPWASGSIGRRPGAAAFLLVSGGLLFAGAGIARPGLADDNAASTAVAAFTRFERAWRGQDPEAVVACLAERGRLRLRLFERPFKRDETYTMLADRALTSLEQYFEDVERLQLVERKPDEERERRDEGSAPERTPTPTVRTYDYAYRVKGKSPVATRLQVRVTEAETGHWVLESVIELPGREERDGDNR